MTEPLYACYGQCGAKITLEGASASGWSFLAVANRWRCGACDRALREVQSTEVSKDGGDVLLKTERGALKELRQPPLLKEPSPPP